MAGQRIIGWVNDALDDVRNLREMVFHRIEKGSPPIESIADRWGISPRLQLDQDQSRIKRRRKLFGLPFEEWTGIGGKK